MRVKKISIHNYGPFQNFEADFGQINLIIGDNERGKSLLLDTAAQSLFEKAPSYVVYEGDNISHRGDASFLKNLLHFRAGELSAVTNWDEEIRALLYGTDAVSRHFQNNFLYALGTDESNPWMSILSEKILAVKEKAEKFLPEIEKIHQNTKKDGTQVQSSDSLEKIRAGREYINLAQEKIDIENELHRTADKSAPSNNFADLDSKIQSLERQIRQKRSKLKMWEQNLPFSERDQLALLFSNILTFLLGFGVFITSLVLVWKGKDFAYIHPLKLTGIGFFLVGVALIIKTIYGEAQRKSGNMETYTPSDKKIEKEHNALIALEKELFHTRSQYAEEASQLRKKNLQPSPLLQELKNLEDQLLVQASKIYALYQSDDPAEVARELDILEKEWDKTSSYSDVEEHENFYEEEKKWYESLEKALQSLKNYACEPYIAARYPQISKWEAQDRKSVRNFVNEANNILKKIDNDKEYAKKIESEYKVLKSKAEDLLFRVFAEESFRQLVQHAFAGKYKTFDITRDQEDLFRISARTGGDQTIPIERLSPSAALQFWFVLKLSLAHYLLGAESGCLLLDDTFASFDAVRTRFFVDILRAFTEEGWQISYAMKDDQLVLDAFAQNFNKINTINLNKEVFHPQ